MPFGRRQKVTVRFPAFSSRQQTTSPARPSWWAGHEALVLEAAGQAHTDPTTFPRSSHQRMGFQGEGTSFPLVFFPLFLQRNRAPAGQAKVPCRFNGVGETPQRAPPGRAPFPTVPTAPAGPLVGLSMICYDKPNKKGETILDQSNRTYDILIIGGGAVGCAVCLLYTSDAADE